uniref:Uncharacterized protein n=1 Tax=Panagrellus redivivus TaxID=6233 RepID=A0A7E4W843_PANRE
MIFLFLKAVLICIWVDSVHCGTFQTKAEMCRRDPNMNLSKDKLPIIQFDTVIPMNLTDSNDTSSDREVVEAFQLQTNSILTPLDKASTPSPKTLEESRDENNLKLSVKSTRPPATLNTWNYPRYGYTYSGYYPAYYYQRGQSGGYYGQMGQTGMMNPYFGGYGQQYYQATVAPATMAPFPTPPPGLQPAQAGSIGGCGTNPFSAGIGMGLAMSTPNGKGMCLGFWMGVLIG